MRLKNLRANHVPAILFPFLLAAICLVIYLPARKFGAIMGDDYLNVLENRYIMAPGLPSLGAVWSGPLLSFYIPVSYTVWMTLHWLANALALAQPEHLYHCANVFFHFVNGTLVFLILRKLDYARILALAGSLLFLVHPFQVEPVVWIVGLRDVLATAFALGATLSSLDFLREVSAVRGAGTVKFTNIPVGSCASATFFFVLALLTKPTMLFLPAVLICVRYFYFRRDWQTPLVLLLPWWALAGGAGLANSIFQFRGHESLWQTSESLWLRPIKVLGNVAFYLERVFFPHAFSFDYGRLTRLLLELPGLYLDATLAIVALAGLWYLVPRERRLAGGGLIALIGLAPVLGIVSFSYQTTSEVADRYMYFSLFGFSLVFAELLKMLARMRGAVFSAVIGGLVLACLTGISMSRVPDWADSKTLFEKAVALNPGASLALGNLGYLAVLKGDHQSALLDFKKQFEVRPHPITLVHLSQEYAFFGQLEAIESLYRQAFERTGLPAAEFGLANVLVLRGKLQEGLSLIDSAVASLPELRSAEFEAGAILVSRHRSELRLDVLMEARKSRPDIHCFAGLAGRASAGDQ